MKETGKWAAAALMVAGLIAFPMEAAEAARTAMVVWATAFAPVLFPFFVVLPALTCPAAAVVYERYLGRAMRALFDCPGRAAGAVAIAWLAGSPAGTLALKRVQGGMTRGELSRAQALCSGTSPAFLIGAVGAMLGSVEAGHMLMRAQLAALIAGGLILRRAWRSDEAAVDGADGAEPAAPARPITGAVIGILTVCGWMVFFGVLSRLVTIVAPPLRLIALPLLEVTGGCAVLSGSALGGAWRIAAVAFTCGIAGLSIALQNRAICPDVPWRRLMGAKLMHGALTALFAVLQGFLPPVAWRSGMGVVPTMIFLGGGLTVLVWALWGILSKRRET